MAMGNIIAYFTANCIALAFLLAPPVCWTMIRSKHNPEVVWLWGMSLGQFFLWLLIVSLLLLPLDARCFLRLGSLEEWKNLESTLGAQLFFFVCIEACLSVLTTSTSRVALILLSPLALFLIITLFSMWEFPGDLNDLLLKLFAGAWMRSPIETEWLFMMATLAAEIALMVLSQVSSPSKPHISATTVAFSAGAMLLCIAELYYKAKKVGAVLKRKGLRFKIRHPYGSKMPVYDYTDAFGLICGIVQIVFSIVEYCYHRYNKENPIKVSTVTVTFILCLACSKLTGRRKEPQLPQWQNP